MLFAMIEKLKGNEELPWKTHLQLQKKLMLYIGKWLAQSKLIGICMYGPLMLTSSSPLHCIIIHSHSKLRLSCYYIHDCHYNNDT